MAKMETLTDSFNDNTTNTSIWSDSKHSESTLLEQNQRLEFNSPTFGRWAQRESLTTYDLTASYAYCQVTLNGDNGSGFPGRFEFFMADGSGNGYRFKIETLGGTVVRLNRMSGGGSETELNNFTYDSTNHKWLRIREASDTIFFEYAPDNGSGAPGSWSTFSGGSETVSTNNPSFSITACKARMYVEDDIILYVDGFNTPINGTGGGISNPSTNSYYYTRLYFLG